MAAQPSSSSSSGTGLTAGTSAVLVPWCTFDRKGARLVVRVVGDQTFRLNVMVTPDSQTSKAVAKSVASAVVNVDGGTAGYVNAAELDIVPHSEVQVEIWAVGGTLGYYFSRRHESY